MAGLIKTTGNVLEGEVMNKWLYNRLIKNNKNVLAATTGPTGSSKSYQDLRKAELWYRHYFKEEFPAENICFSVAEVMRLVSSGKLRKGEIVIFEEAGTNLGSLDFQNRIVKLFTYVLQVFRSLNIAMFFNLPYLTMLTKSARMLIHVQFETCGIDYTNKITKSKCFFLQVNQGTGKVYKKFLRIKHDGKVQIIKRFNYSLPSKRLIDIYEQKKLKFVTDMTTDFSAELDNLERDKLRKMGRKGLTIKQQEVMTLVQDGYKVTEIAEIIGIAVPSVYDRLENIKNKGYLVGILHHPLKKDDSGVIKPTPIPI